MRKQLKNRKTKSNMQAPPLLEKTQRASKAEHKKNFGLTESAFNELAEALRQGDNRLFEQVFLAHFQECMSYLKQRYGASHEEAYDAAMDTLVEFHGRLLERKVRYGNLRFLFTQMAGQAYIRSARKEKLHVSGEGLEIAEEAEGMEEEALRCLHKAWERLGESCQYILKGYYYFRNAPQEIAAKLEKSDAAVRKQKQRCMEKLREFFQEYYHE